MDDFEKITLEEIMDLVEDAYQDNCYSFVCGSAKTYKYKDQYVKISVAKDEDDL